MIHLAIHSAGRLSDPTQTVAFTAAVALAMRPKSDRLLMVLAAAQIVDWWSFAPMNPDHWTLVMATNSILLIGGLWKFIGGRSESEPVAELMLGPLRAALLVAYGAAAFAKWNSTFLTPSLSCAGFLLGYASLGQLDGNVTAQQVAVWVSVLTESAVAILLAIPRTRRYGARLGLLFHSLLSLSPVLNVGDFTATVSALFILFLPRSDIANALDWLRSANSKSTIVGLLRRHRWVIPIVLIGVGGFSGYLQPEQSLLARWAVITLFQMGCVLLPILMVTRRSTMVDGPRSPERTAAWLAAPAVFFLVFTAVNPYIGLRTWGSFTMFSNLRTEAGHNNHLIAPTWAIADYQSELFEVEDSNQNYLKEVGEHGEVIPVASLHGLVEISDSSAWATGRIDGQEVRWTAADPMATIGQPSFFERYLLNFRSFELDNPNPRCGN